MNGLHRQHTLLPPSGTIREAIEYLDRNDFQIVLVVDGQDRLLGTITDGDVRRALLANIDLDDTAGRIMNTHPVVAHASDGAEAIRQLMTRQGLLRHIPVVDGDNRVVRIETLKQLLGTTPRENWVVLMAGGQGNRLRPLTQRCPKPLLEVGGRPILHTIVEGFAEQGFEQLFVSVNYLADMVEQALGDGDRWGTNIHYLRERQRLGTAGALANLPRRPTHPTIVMNADILTKVDYRLLLDFHAEHRCAATMCVREYTVEVPYGVVEVEGQQIVGIDEKPVQRHFINAGIYVLEPEVFDLLDPDQPMDMPQLFERLLEKGLSSAVFPIREYWLDIGLLDDYQRANQEFHIEFNNSDERPA